MWVWFPEGQSLIQFLHMRSRSFKNFRKMTKSEVVPKKIRPGRAAGHGFALHVAVALGCGQAVELYCPPRPVAICEPILPLKDISLDLPDTTSVGKNVR